ncbi:MAG: VWA domain-containing protein [Bryobacteraceae bacterium]
MPCTIRVWPQVPARLAALFAAFLFSFSVGAQTVPVLAGTTGPGPAAGNGPELTLELSAHDRKGNPVLDLAASEVQIVEGGKPVPVSSLRLVTAPQAPPIVTLLFDEVVPGVAKQDRDLADELIKEASGHGVLFTVLRGEGRLHLVQGPTTDVEAARQAAAVTTVADRSQAVQATEAAERQMEEDAKSASGSRQMMAKILKAMLLDSQRILKTDGRATPSVAGLLAASRGQEILPGRKFIVFFSEGIRYYANSPEELRNIAQAANRAHVTIYAVDSEIGDPEAAIGMRSSAAMGSETMTGGLATSSTDPAGEGAVASEFAGRIIAGEGGGTPQSLEGICLSTGGAHVYALGGDSRNRTRGIADDLTSYYLASWTSPGTDETSRRRPFRVQSLRKGVVIQSRYVARPGDKVAVSAVEGRLLEALAAPKLAADLPLHAAVLRFGNTPDNLVNSVVVQVPLEHPASGPESAAPSAGDVSVLAQLKDPAGAVVRKFSEDISNRRTLGNPKPASPDMATLRRQFSLPPGDYVLESVAMDAHGGKIGARRDNVSIPAVGKGLALGDVLLVRSIDPGASEAGDPLRYAEGTVVPNLSGHVSKAAGPKIGFFFDIHADPGSSEAPALSMELRRDDVLAATVPLKLTLDPKRQTIPYMFALGAAGFSPGQYQVTVILTQGGRNVSNSLRFTLD